jgi:hypothetical protein
MRIEFTRRLQIYSGSLNNFGHSLMTLTTIETPAAWRTADLESDHSWVFSIDAAARTHLAQIVKAAYVPEKPLFEYTKEDFDLGAAWVTIASAIKEAHHGRGLALVHGMPREGLSEKEFELMNWTVGLHTGVARPQGRVTQYISAVRDVGTDYRAASGRGYSSNAKLDFHVDGADLVSLSCYNKAKSGGQSMITSAVTARNQLIAERPDLAEIAHRDFYFSRQNEEAPDEEPYYVQPLFDLSDGQLFSKWNRNRVQSAQKFDGVPQLSAAQRETMDVLDDILRRPEFMYTMYLEQGDMMLMNNHLILHSRTDYIDYEAPEQKRLLCRLWLALPDSARLPESWGDFYRSVLPGAVRGGIRGHQHDDVCQAFERRQAASMGMSVGVSVAP